VSTEGQKTAEGAVQAGVHARISVLGASKDQRGDAVEVGAVARSTIQAQKVVGHSFAVGTQTGVTTQSSKMVGAVVEASTMALLQLQLQKITGGQVQAGAVVDSAVLGGLMDMRGGVVSAGASTGASLSTSKTAGGSVAQEGYVEVSSAAQKIGTAAFIFGSHSRVSLVPFRLSGGTVRAQAIATVQVTGQNPAQVIVLHYLDTESYSATNLAFQAGGMSEVQIEAEGMSEVGFQSHGTSEALMESHGTSSLEYEQRRAPR